MKFKIKLLEFGDVLQNGKTYNKETFQQQLVELNHNQIRGTIDNSIGEITHVVSNFSINDNDDLIADIDITNTPSGKLVQEIIKQKSNISVKPMGSFSTKENGEITDYVLNGFSIEL